MPFSSAVIYGQIQVTATGETIDLWQPDYPYLKSAKISLSRGGIAETEISLEIPWTTFEDIVDHTQPHIFDVGNIIALKFGYSLQGIYTPWYYGLVTEPEVSFSTDTASIQLPGHPVQSVMRTSAVKSWKNVTAKTILEEVMSKYGYQVIFHGADASTRFNVKIPVLDQGGATDWETIRGLIEKRGCNFWLGTDSGKGKATLFVSSLKDENTSQPVRTYAWRGSIDIVNNVFPLLSYSAQSRASWLPTIAQGIVSNDIDKDNKKVETIKVSLPTSLAPSTMYTVMNESNTDAGKKDRISGIVTGKGIVESKKETQATVYHPTGENKSLSKDFLQGNYDARRGQAGIAATVSILGDPDVLPQDLVRLTGLTNRFDGVYRVDKVEHEISDGKWTTNLELICEGFNKGIDFGKQATNYNGNMRVVGRNSFI